MSDPAALQPLLGRVPLASIAPAPNVGNRRQIASHARRLSITDH
jgi:hypothetical protein